MQITPATQLSDIQAKSCVPESVTVKVSDSTNVCWFKWPVIQICGGYRDASPDEIQVVLTDARGISLVLATTLDCPLGDGYYTDEVNRGLAQCASTCDTLADVSAAADLYSSCVVGHCFK
jgi:hypothetical protein